MGEERLFYDNTTQKKFSLGLLLDQTNVECYEGRLSSHLLGYLWYIPSHWSDMCRQANDVRAQLLWQPESQRLLCSMVI